MNTNESAQQTSHYLSAAVSAVLSLAAASAAHGGPQNGVVTSGAAVISTPDVNLTQIDQGSHSASIDWQSFDVAAQERVIFNQPSASSVALNRILAQDPSQIHGSISANGRVFLLNPNGVIFGASSRINVGSLVASSLDIADVDAATGRYSFNTTASQSGAISNSGQITAADGGSVTLLGGSVVNNGLIVADYGSVNLGAGRAATLHFDGDGLVRFQIDAGLLANSSRAGAAVDNTGEIVADGGQVLLTARAASDVIARAVNNDGVIRAARIENVGGSIRLVGPEGAVVNSGVLDATGVGAAGAGGQVQVLGDRVELSGTALIDVSGNAGSGSVSIGGGFHGADPTILNAQQTDVHAGAVISANSISGGDAGQVAVWADGATTFHGDIFARALGADGAGGFVEVSGREQLRIGGHAWLESVHGVAGTLLLDPGTVTITQGGDTDPPADFNLVNDGWINAQLATGSLAITTSGPLGAGPEDLTVDDSASITWSNDNSLTLTGANSISLEADSGIANTLGAGTLTLVSSGAVSMGGSIVLAGGLTVDAGGDITQGAGALSVGGDATFTTNANRSIALDSPGNSFAGAVNFASGGPPGNLLHVTLRDSTALDLQALTIDGDLTVAATSITQLGGLDVGGSASFTSAAALNLQALTIDGNLAVTAGGAISQSGALSVVGAASFRTLNDAGAGITLNGINSFGSIEAAVRNAADTVNAAANILIQENDDTLLGDLQTGSAQSVSVVSAGAIAALANTDISTGSVALAASGDIGTAAAPVSLVTANGRIDAESSGSVYLTNTSGVGSTVALDRVVAGAAGAAELVSDGDIWVYDVRAGDSVSLTSTNGGILDDNADGAGSQIVTGSLTLQAAGSIGQAAGVGNGTLDLQTGSASATAQGGGIYLDETDGDISIREVNAAGPVWIQAASGSIVDDPNDANAASVMSAAGGVQLSALNNIGAVTDVRTRQGAPLVIDTNGGALSARVASATGQINLGIASGSNPTAAAAAISAGGSGRLLIQSAGDLSLASFNAAISGFTEAGFSSDGILSVREQQSELIAGPLTTLLLRGGNDIVQADRVFDLSATRLIFESGAQGGDVTLNTNVDQLDVVLGAGANLTIVEGLGDLALGDISAGGNVSIRAANILDDGDLSGITRVAAGSTLSLLASAGIGEEGAGGGRIDTAGASVSVLAEAGPVFITHLGDLQLSGEARGGLIDVAAPTGGITVNGVLRATGSLTLTAGGAIADAADATTHLSASDANLTATLIGSASNRLDIDVGSLSASAPDGIYLNAANAVQLRTVSAQNVVINAAGAITDDGDAQTRIAAGAVALSGSSIGAAGAGIDTSVDGLSATASAGGVYIDELGDIELARVSAGGGSDVAIVATGAITDDGDDATRVSGGNLTLAASSIGAAGAGSEIDAQATTLTATASGGVFIREADDLQLNAITAGGDIVIAAVGALFDDGADATRVTGANVTLTGSRIGAADNHVDTAAAVLSATATDGGIYADEQDDITLARVASSGVGNTVDLRTANNGSVIVENLTTQGGAVNLAAGGTGSLNVTGAIASNNGVVNLTAGNALAVPGLSTGTGSVVLHTVNDLNVGTITAGSVSITSDTGDILLGTVNAGTGTASITADNGAINDGAATSLAAGEATLSARSIGSADNPLNVAVDTLTAHSSAGGVFIDDAGGLNVTNISAAGDVSLATSGALVQAGEITSAGNGISVFGDSIEMQALATTISASGDITYGATGGDILLGVLDAGGGRALVIAADDVYSALGSTSATNNITASAVEVRAGGLGAGAGEIGTISSPLAIATSSSALRSVFLVVPTLNGIQTSTPRINYAGPSFSLLLKGYSGSSGALLFDQSSAFTADTVLQNGESIVPLLNGRVAINSDSLSAAKQALSSGVISRVNVDWAAFDPNVSLFGVLDPALRLPADQIEEVMTSD